MTKSFNLKLLLNLVKVVAKFKKKSKFKKITRQRIIMDHCITGQCKKKLGEYRELTSKLYNDMDNLEDEIKDKDAFLQKVVKARNNLQEDNANLKKEKC